MAIKRILVAAVDIDDDLGSLGIKGPVVGKDKVLEAAIKFGLQRPEDSDLNTLFAALSVAEMLRSQSMDVEVAILTGSPKGGVEADMNVRRQLLEIVSKTPVDGVVLVVDSPEDEKVIPIIQDIVPIISIKKVVVEQSRGLEQTYLLLHKFVKKVTEERRFARYVLGVPGLILFIFSLFSITGLISYSIPVLGIILGLYMIVKGYGIDEALKSWWKSNPIAAATSLLAISMFLISLGVTYLTLSQYGGITLKAIGDIMVNALPFASIGITIMILSKIIEKIRTKDLTIWREATVLSVVTAITIVMVQVGRALSSLPLKSTYGQALRKIISSDVIRTIIVASLSVLGVAIAMALVERWILERGITAEDEHGRPARELRP